VIKQTSHFRICLQFCLLFVGLLLVSKPVKAADILYLHIETRGVNANLSDNYLLADYLRELVYFSPHFSGTGSTFTEGVISNDCENFHGVSEIGRCFPIDLDQFDQIWVSDLSSGIDELAQHMEGYRQVARWFNNRGRDNLIMDGRIQSSSESWILRRRSPEAAMGFERNWIGNYAIELDSRGGGLLLGTDHSAFSFNGINRIANQIGVGEFSSVYFESPYQSVVDPSSPLYLDTLDPCETLTAQVCINDNSSTGTVPIGAQPNGMVLFPAAYHVRGNSADFNAPSISSSFSQVDRDGDGVPDDDDAFPDDPTESADSDGDGVGDNSDVFPDDETEWADTDGDGVGNNGDAFPTNPTEWADSDGDGVGDNSDDFPDDASETTDTDGDGVGDNADVFPSDPAESVDTDGDGVGDNGDAFPNDASESADTDGDGVGNNADAFPNDPAESVDSDGDGVGDNGDAFPNDASESADSDGDGIGDNADAFPLDSSETTDSDGDGVGDNGDVFPNDPAESADSDGDGVGDNGDAFPNDASESADADGDDVGDNADAFPNDPAESVDSDGDGVGDNGDVFPNDASESADSDGDGVGDNADAFPNDATEDTDTDGDGIGDNADPYDDSDFSETVSIEGIETGVANSMIAAGISLADHIAATSQACITGAKNHGAYVKCMGNELKALRSAGTISRSERNALQRAVAQTDSGKKSGKSEKSEKSSKSGKSDKSKKSGKSKK